MTYAIIIVALMLLTAAFILIRTVMFARSSDQAYPVFDSNVPELELDPLIPATHLSTVVKIETISHEDPAKNKTANFRELHARLEEMYPLVHKTLTREWVDQFSLVYTWKGKNPELEPVAFMAHQDVVPADSHTIDQWTYPPFSGQIADGYIWGRGTQDIKCQMIAVLDAVENLLKNKFQPERTVILAFGHDEEVLGTGAVMIVKHLQEKGIHLQAVLDEGGCVYDGIIPGIKGYAATIGVAEKGYLSLRLKVEAKGGHSSTPTRETAIGILCHAIDRLQAHPFPYKVRAVLPMFKGLSPAASPVMQMAFANLWLFRGILQRKLAADPETAASIHTTIAPTIIHGGVKDNVLPGLAEAVVNFRILPGENIASVCERVRKIIDDERVSFEPVSGTSREPSPVSDTDCDFYRHLAALNEEFFEGAVSAPYVMLGGTDAYHFTEISSQVYRYSPCVMNKEDLKGVHGINERLSIDAMAIMVKYFYSLIQRWGAKEVSDQ